MKIFVDSGILVEYIKGRRVDLYEFLIQQEHDLFINQVVFSEFLFHFIAVTGNKSPMSVKESGKIAECFKDYNPLDMLPGLHFLEHSPKVSVSAMDLMKRFNLLPNDALILASCLENQIECLATYDSDFEIPCKSLEIRIFNNENDLKNFIPRI